MTRKLYIILKALFLTTQGAVMPMAFYYLFNCGHEIITRGIMVVAIYLICPFWVILFVGMGSYRFPLRLAGASQVVGATFLQLLLFWLFGGDIFYSFYVLFFSSLAGIIIFLSGVFIFQVWRPKTKRRAAGDLKFIIGALLILISLIILLVSLTGPLWSELTGLAGIKLAVLLLTMLIQIGTIARTTYRSLQEDKNPVDYEAREASWKVWASPTAMILILSLGAALAVAMTV